mmetsp:Transcript_29869/g.83468  ORF Transcript_29869/g.83468 Transcript_29869/m.83468 type:complete len:232 (-) Transcript_29869:393-1088(-)
MAMPWLVIAHESRMRCSSARRVPSWPRPTSVRLVLEASRYLSPQRLLSWPRLSPSGQRATSRWVRPVRHVMDVRHWCVTGHPAIFSTRSRARPLRVISALSVTEVPCSSRWRSCVSCASCSTSSTRRPTWWHHPSLRVSRAPRRPRGATASGRLRHISRFRCFSAPSVAIASTAPPPSLSSPSQLSDSSRPRPLRCSNPSSASPGQKSSRSSFSRLQAAKGSSARDVSAEQ